MRIIDTNYFFSGDFQGQEGVCIMHQCALYNPKYSSLVLFDAQLDLLKGKKINKQVQLSVKVQYSTFLD